MTNAPTRIQRLIDRYVKNQPLTQQEQDTLDEALIRFPHLIDELKLQRDVAKIVRTKGD
jgi:ribosome assembly protein YihI (activator of Der GTPase)